MKRLLPAGFGCFLLLVFSCFSLPLSAQMITGVWKGKINRQRVEVKIIQNGDSLTGTSYYYESANNYRRYTIKGYFDQATNAAVWWDDQLVEEKSGRFSISTPGKMPMLSRADFNCPGGSRMMLDGKVARRDEELDIKGDVHLDKSSDPEFEDEWDFVIGNYTIGANDPDIIDSIGAIALSSHSVTDEPIKTRPEEKKPVVITSATPKSGDPSTQNVQKPGPVIQRPAPVAVAVPVKAPTIEEKFVTRKKVFIKEIPVSGDSVELRFYDNAEIDGDSISLFLNDKLLFQHIRLTGNAYSIKLAVSELNETNELTMVAENLGAIPPNTSYMVVMVNEKKYDAYLASSEGSSAMIRFVKKDP
ncbi:MAG TPA: hypothetical protein VMZ03_11620 [Chitinophagaceae bacterium]|nr:hypothetical protein [Chitinophagaceae bacterium]